MIINLLALTFTAIYAGICLITLIVLVPFWKALPAQQFLQWFSNYSAYLGATALPSNLLAVIFILWSFIRSVSFREPGSLPWGFGSLFILLTVLMLPVFFKHQNNAFIHKSIPIDQVSVEIARWAKWHLYRTIFAFLGAVSAIAALFFSFGKIS